jgi:transcriptional regulator with XRE-family HTH domain
MRVDTGQIGQRLQALRQLYGIKTQGEMARLCGVTNGNYSEFESGNRRVSLDVALRLAEVFDVSLDWIYLGRIGGMPYSLAIKLQGLKPQP